MPSFGHIKPADFWETNSWRRIAENEKSTDFPKTVHSE